MALLDFLPAIKSAVVGPIRSVLISLRTALDTITHILDTVRETSEDVIGIYHEIQHFDLKPHWQTRVLSAPDAIQNVKDLSEVPAKIFIAIKDIISRVRNKVQPISAAQAEAEAAMEEASGVEGFFLRVFPRLAKLIARGIAKLLAIVGIVVEVVIDVANTLNDIKVLVGQFRVAIESLNHLDAVFLRQNKKRQTLRLEDGSTIRIRIPRRTQ